jgi:hypothetical protein
MRDQAVEDAIAANKRLADRLAIRGMPFYLVGDRPVAEGGDLSAALAAKVAEIRATGCRAAC